MNRVFLGLVGAVTLASTTAAAQNYPSKPITLIIPFAAGGSNDIVGRAIGKNLAEAWGQPVLIDNRLGAGGMIGATAVAGAKPDGYTLLLVSSTFTINPAIKKSMPFDTAKDFTPIAFVARSPLLLTASNKLPVNSAKELLDLARSKPGTINYASSGPGSINQISAELIALSAGVKLMHIPYKGGSLALNDLIGGHVDIYVSSLPQVLEVVRSGRAKGLAVTGERRLAALPEVATFDEQGIHGMDVQSWWGIVGPAGMPAPVVQRLNAELSGVLADEDLRAVLAKMTVVPTPGTPQAFGAYIAEEARRWRRFVAESGLNLAD